MDDSVATPYGRATRFLTDTLPSYADWPLRLAFAAVFLYHGLDKLTGGVGTFATNMDLSEGLAWLVALSEVAAGFFVLVGGLGFPGARLMTRLGGALVIPVMIGAIERHHWSKWAFAPDATHPMGGMEFQLLMIGLGLFFVVTAGRIDTEDRAREVGL